MDTHESSRHWRVAWEEKRLAFLEEAGKAVADRVSAEVGAVVADSDDDCCGFIGA